MVAFVPWVVDRLFIGAWPCLLAVVGWVSLTDGPFIRTYFVACLLPVSLPLVYRRAVASDQRDLQKAIVARERSLGMRTVLGAFAGHVPDALKARYPSANVTKSPSWCGFNER